ncbi:peptide chain release factor N(5)-glutamine methyltransferase [Larsenimonas rhizosphaerae]|uniref:Release factor glutamine methyltransferase n=1 Tax=Larsenimonas rhizosphaerae TaxID=2944682 RepID=A0AA42CTP2_9GAMM|nr:peptide chain release factor N(5)-glutamine methyltransferase [Larsenimonas rhizosphaerae]MCX2523822.1 peptide chain release factor N(5)-glutamine methyltransferase [Larsenimonas rhizosphaerae]
MSAARIDAVLAEAAEQLGNISDTARLDADVLLAHVLERSRTWLYTWNDRLVDSSDLAAYQALVSRRAEGEPVAYLVGEREFWGLPLYTSPATLIPRPDTECLVEQALMRMPGKTGQLLDLGTGTGAIALALKSERPGWDVTAVDLFDEAVALARRNAQRLNLDIRCRQGNWFDGLPPMHFDVIVSNPPYIADHDEHLDQGDVRFEPRSALVATGEGLDDLAHLVNEARTWLFPGGWLLLEHGHGQGEAVRCAMHQAGFGHIDTVQDIGRRDRVTLARLT